MQSSSPAAKKTAQMNKHKKYCKYIPRYTILLISIQSGERGEGGGGIDYHHHQLYMRFCVPSPPVNFQKDKEHIHAIREV